MAKKCQQREENSASHGGPEGAREPQQVLSRGWRDQRSVLSERSACSGGPTGEARWRAITGCPASAPPAPISLSQTLVQRMWLHEDVGEAR